MSKIKLARLIIAEEKGSPKVIDLQRKKIYSAVYCWCHTGKVCLGAKDERTLKNLDLDEFEEIICPGWIATPCKTCGRNCGC